MARINLARLGSAVLLGALLSGCAEDWGPDQHGATVSAADLKSRWLIINYWAQWCAPCRTEIPEFNALATELDGQNVAVLGVNFDALQGDALKKATDEFAITFTVLAQDPAARLALERNDVLPVTYIIDPQGVVRERLLGEQTKTGLLEHLARLQQQ